MNLCKTQQADKLLEAVYADENINFAATCFVLTAKKTR